MKVIHIPTNPSPIKSIQRGAFPNYQASPTVTVAAVDMNKSVLNVHSKHSASSDAGWGSYNGGGKITSPTQLTFYTDAHQANMRAYGQTFWELIEYV